MSFPTSNAKHSLIEHSVLEAIRAINTLNSPYALNFIESAAQAIAHCFQRGNKLILAGNGGSLCDANHFAEELTGFFRAKRKALPALVLNDAAHMSCTGNDVGFDKVFSRGVEAFSQEGDIFIGLTTSGTSPNIIQAFDAAIAFKLQTIAFLGKGGGKLKGIADIEFLVDPTLKTSDRIQEVHMTAIHIIIELIESKLFASIPC